jgi:predicted short-subunit dehydrogenase-like oxidoreductase (DUF2520 family)
LTRSGAKPRAKARLVARKLRARFSEDAAQVDADLFWLCVPDSQIRETSRQLSAQRGWKGIVVLHSSGALTSDELQDLQARGARIASAHPMMTFVGSSQPSFAGVPFAIEGDAAAVRVAKKIVLSLGAQAYPIRKRDKAAYHAWATFASPLFTALLATTEQVARLAGVPAKEARKRMTPILRQTLANYAARAAPKAFSGPIIRGDVDTVKRHLRALGVSGPVMEVYRALARAATLYLPVRNRDQLRQALAPDGTPGVHKSAGRARGREAKPRSESALISPK